MNLRRLIKALWGTLWGLTNVFLGLFRGHWGCDGSFWSDISSIFEGNGVVEVQDRISKRLLECGGPRLKCFGNNELLCGGSVGRYSFLNAVAFLVGYCKPRVVTLRRKQILFQRGVERTNSIERMDNNNISSTQNATNDNSSRNGFNNTSIHQDIVGFVSNDGSSNVCRAPVLE